MVCHEQPTLSFQPFRLHCPFPTHILPKAALYQYSLPRNLSANVWSIRLWVERIQMILKSPHNCSWRIDAFKRWCWRRLLRVPWTARRSNQSILKEINPEYSLEGLMLKLQYLGHLMWRIYSLERPWCWERLKAEERMRTECEMLGWHHQLNGHGFAQKPGNSKGQGSLVYCSPCGHKELDSAEWLNNNKAERHQSSNKFERHLNSNQQRWGMQ